MTFDMYEMLLISYLVGFAATLQQGTILPKVLKGQDDIPTVFTYAVLWPIVFVVRTLLALYIAYRYLAMREAFSRAQVGGGEGRGRATFAEKPSDDYLNKAKR